MSHYNALGYPPKNWFGLGCLSCRSCNEIFLSMHNIVQILPRRGCLASTQVPWHLHIPKLPRYEQFHHPLPLLASYYWIKCIFPTVGANSTLTVVSCNCKSSLTEQVLPYSVGRCQLLKECLAWSASTHPHRASQLARTQICMQWSHFKDLGGTCVRFSYNAILLLLLLPIQ